ncbi:MAG TPA: bifunctional precorrin-2 dehydrogenase/sirohydrochlorin ferrochelatase [Candidatus Scybalocola faecavium]|nr:bifunctional precorrin-2 dehydrogenase/sirohydrochlorin ferrochelatase [Candidatus Scybalocola faecavium]
MALFPLFVNIEGRSCLVFGGGNVALRKIRTLLAAGAHVRVRSVEYVPELLKMAEKGQIVFEEDRPVKALVQDAFLVVCATSDPDFNDAVACICREKRIPVNCASGKGVSSFIFPSLILKDNISIGISLQPPAPSLSKQIREDIEDTLPDWYGVLGKSLAAYRSLLKSLVPDEEARHKIMARLTRYGLDHEGDIPEEIFYSMIKEVCP